MTSITPVSRLLGHFADHFMLDTLKQIIVDHQEDEFQTGIRRLTDIAPVAGKATVCIGPRRSGKSTYLFQRIQGLIDAGVSVWWHRSPPES